MSQFLLPRFMVVLSIVNLGMFEIAISINFKSITFPQIHLIKSNKCFRLPTFKNVISGSTLGACGNTRIKALHYKSEAHVFDS